MAVDFQIAITALSAAKKMLYSFIESRDDKLTKEALAPIENEILKIENQMLLTQQENQRLQAVIDQAKNWEKEKARYEPHYFPTGQFAYVLTSLKDTEHAPVHFCASCMDNDRAIQQLQKSKSGESVICQRCSTGFETGHKHDFKFKEMGHKMSH